jgi:hypothetical protein
MNATRSIEGAYGMIYSATSRSYVLNPKSLSGGSFQYWWFNPRDGGHVDLGVFRRSSLIEVTPPFKGEDLDWILVIDDAAQDFPPPGSGKVLSTADQGQLRFG